MEAFPALRSNCGLKHRPLTPFRVFRGLLCLVILLSTAFMFLVYFGPVAAALLRFFSINLSRKTISFLFGLWLALWPFLFEKINRTKVIFSGETVPSRERVLLVANHRTEVDWMYLWDLALRKGCLGYIKYVLKSSLMKLPIFGWGFHILEFIPVERKWEIDEQIMHQMLSTFTNPSDPLWLAVFPEGTDYTEQKCRRSQKFAAENGLPVLKNVLLPKTRGFYACLEILRGSLDAVYDITIAYKHHCPSFVDNLFGVDPSEVHIHVQRVSIKEMPASESETATWLINKFQCKDELLSEFRAQGQFPREGTEGELSNFKCSVNATAVIALTGVFIFLTFCSSIWFRLYLGLACAYLASATYLNFRPLPVLGVVKPILCSDETKKL
ncbi:probable 1-acyl-sn-glycerol-3-phosphate acyltransferase 4 [Actinidia eriantha]|uniref:probable 1-acyl-sn-glycerol-3-phosphate acyltransferase 4 n=1 Tax=Actinidia eriantha TaxID=165200 RepID=UPI002590F914|nr:probable 1-acyl-sn-glycerol-3-phosphate acyltransferase 4 [Actinidia eriantha]XP_057468979.1 probable 1-acyl-sn-glycerol-3-phosphate acyltransferase 4 [Actinidia eriantha]